MPAQSELERVDLSKFTFAPDCEACTHKGQTTQAVFIAKGCADKRPVLMCQACLNRGLEVIAMYVRIWQQTNKRVFICGDCYRPLFNLDTHLEVKRLHP